MKQEQLSRQETVERFRARLGDVIRRSGLSRSAFAAKVGIDRSTLSQILSPATDRLPRVETLATIAASEQVSLDWLVGLSQEGALGTTILPALEISRGLSSPTDERLQRWYDEAAGYKIRHVPANLPDVLKTDEVIEYEYRLSVSASPEQRMLHTQQSLAYQRRLDTDTEVCTPVQALEAFARGEDLWSELDRRARIRQMKRFIALTDELYPTFRWFLYDGRRRFSVPLTVFGSKRAVIYIGQGYSVFNGLEHIRSFTSHFDDLIRGAAVQAHDVGRVLHELRDSV